MGMEPRRGTDDPEDEPHGFLGKDERVGEKGSLLPGIKTEVKKLRS
jgi:hypothetical protein